jgi:hypothetical protein
MQRRTTGDATTKTASLRRAGLDGELSLQALHHGEGLVPAWVAINAPGDFEAKSAIKVGRLEVVRL